MNNTQEKNRNTRKIFLSEDPRIEFFNSHAPNWDNMGPNIDETLSKLDGFKQRLGFRPGMRIIEIGCGTGQITGWISEIVKPGKVVAVDFSPAMIEVAKSKNICAEFRVMDVCADFIEEKFDVAFCFNSFPHFRDKTAALKNIYNMLFDNGYLIILHFSGSRELNEFHRSVGGAVENDTLPDEQEFRRLLSATNFQISEFEDRPELFFLRAFPRR